MTEENAAAGAGPTNDAGDQAPIENAGATAPAAGQPESAPDTTDGPAKIAELTAQNSELRDRHVRLQAEFENFRKRKIREGDEIRAYAAASVLGDILPVLDHLELALTPAHDRADPEWSKGIDLIARQLADALRANGLEEITASPGEKFDPAWHEAVGEETTDGAVAGSIVRVLRKGFRLRERLLRAAQVVVARTASAGGAAPAAES